MENGKNVGETNEIDEIINWIKFGKKLTEIEENVWKIRKKIEYIPTI